MKDFCCELRYFQVTLSWASNPETLFLEKCEMIKKSSLRYPEGLKIYFDGAVWIFDYLPTKSEASKVLVEASLPRFEVAKINNKIKYRGRKK